MAEETTDTSTVTDNSDTATTDTVADVTTESTTAAESTTATPATSLLDVAGLVKPDGSFVEGWHESESLPEELRGNKSLAVIKNLTDLAKRTVNAESMVGKNKVALPGENAKPEEVEAFWQAVTSANPAMGKPATADEYAVDIPDDMAELFTDERVGETKKLAHDMGLTKGQFEAYMKHEIETAQRIVAEQESEDRRINDENVLALKTEWGEAYAERQHVVKRLIAEAFGNDKSGELAFLQQYAGDPDFVRFAANVGVKLVEHKALVADLQHETPVEATRKIAELQATPGYMNMGSPMTQEQRSEIANQIREQYKIAYPEHKTG